MLAYLQALSALELGGITVAYMVGRWFLVCGFFFGIRRWISDGRRVTPLKPRRGQLAKELRSNIAVVSIDILTVFAVIHFKIVTDHGFSWLGFAASFSVCFLAYDAWFYACHRLLHHRRFRRHHHLHHMSVAPTPLSAMTFSFVEKSLLESGMVLLALSSHAVPLVFEGFIAYFLFNFLANVGGHSDVELSTPRLSRSLYGRLFTTATYHSLHHTRGTSNFGLFLTFFDSAFGTRDPSYNDALADLVVKSMRRSTDDVAFARPPVSRAGPRSTRRAA